MSLNFLEFEKPIAELEAKIEALRDVSRHGGDAAVDLDKEIEQLEKKSLELKKKIFSDLRCVASGATCTPPATSVYQRLPRACLHRV